MSSEILLGGLATVVAVAIAVGAALLVQRYIPVDGRQENNDVAGIAFAIIGVLYAILLTFVTISVWETSDSAKESTRNEARDIVNLNHYADTLPAPDRARLRALTDHYVQLVEQDEWPAMAKGRPVGGQGGATLDAIWSLVDGPPPADDGLAARQAEARGDLKDLTSARDARLAAIGAGLPRVMWFALLVGAALTLGNALMFGVRGSGQYITIIAMLAAMSALMLFAVYELEYPYQRGESVTVSVFDDVLGGQTAR